MTISIIPKIKYFFFDGSKVTDKESFFAAIATAMDFPSTFGHTWDTFEADLNNLSWVEEDYKVLVWIDPTNFRQNHPDDFKRCAALIVEAMQIGVFKIHNLTIAMMSLIQYV